MESTGGKIVDTFIKRAISSDASLPPSLPLVVARSEEFNQDGTVGLEIVPESLELLRSIEKPIAPVAICGPYRTGKSYFLSRMVGDSECFKVTHSTEACTRGIWMATTVLECPEFVVVFFDTEGIGAVDDSSQGSINFMISTALISSLLIYNTKRPLQMKDIEKLRWCIAMSKHFQRKGSKFRPEMPRFLWLLRDMDLSTGSGSPTDWLVKKLQVPRCKEIFEALKSAFSSIECTFLPPPALENEVLQDIVQRRDQLTPRFNEEVDKAKSLILSVVEPKRCECGPFTGFSLASLIEECVAEVNHQSDVPGLETTWKVATDLQLQNFISQLVAEYEEEMRSTLKDKLPMEEGSSQSIGEDTLMGIHNEIVKKKAASLEKKLASLVPVKDIQNVFLETAHREFLNRILQKDKSGRITGGKLAAFLHDNYVMSNELCTKTYDKFYDQLVASKLRCAFAEGIPYDITPDVAQFKEKYDKIACGPAKEEVFTNGRTNSEIEERKLEQIPGHIHNLKATCIRCDCVQLSWEPPLENPGAVQVYEVYSAKEEGTLELTKTTSTCDALVQDLESSQQYTFVVRARSEQFLGNHVSFVSVKTSLSDAARISIGVGTFIACGVAAPIVYPTMVTLGVVSCICREIKEGNCGLAQGIAAGAGTLAVMSLTLPIGVLGTAFAAPLIAKEVFERIGD